MSLIIENKPETVARTGSQSPGSGSGGRPGTVAGAADRARVLAIGLDRQIAILAGDGAGRDADRQAGQRLDAERLSARRHLGVDDDLPGPALDDLDQRMRQHRNEHAAAQAEHEFRDEVGAARLHPLEHARAVEPGVGKGHLATQVGRGRRLVNGDDMVGEE